MTRHHAVTLLGWAGVTTFCVVVWWVVIEALISLVTL